MEITDKQAYIAFNLMEKIGPVTVRNLIGFCGSAAAVLKERAEALRKADGISRTAVDALLAQRDSVKWQAELEQCEAEGIRLLTPVDAEYPESLKQIYDPPLALYIRGSLLARDRQSISVVGTRRPSIYGGSTAERIAGGLARAGLTVVSGMAAGIDSAAHRGALDAGGRTVGVLGSGFQHFYPRENLSLAERICAGQGAVLSEFPLDRKPDKTTFPMRNRIVSGMTLGTVVVEAGLRSGAMITARMALEQGRNVFAVPGRIDSVRSHGPHALLRDGAVLVENCGDILDEFEELPLFKSAAHSGISAATVTLNSDEQAVISQLEQEAPLNVDTLLRKTGLAVGAIHATMVSLEMKRLIRIHPGQKVSLVDRKGD